MKILKFLLAAMATWAVVWALSTPFQKGAVGIPPLGPLVNPFSGFWRNAEPLTGPQFDAEVDLPGLKGEVKVVYDDLLVPHIFAENETDAAMLQGYIIAQHRLFQMDLTARKVSGRLSEVIGERTLEVDRMSRRKGLAWSAERDLEAWKKSPEDVALLDAYTAGVNAWIAGLSPADYPVEFKLLGYAPEPWSPLKSAYVVQAMAETLANYDNDLAATNALAILGEETFQSLYPVWNPKQLPIVPAGYYPKATETANTTEMTGAETSFLPGGDIAPLEIDPTISGSNNWALAGSKTASGHPLLCNDPHLTLTLPSIWFQVQIHTPAANRYGVSLSGIPGIVIGFSENTAWGMTNVGVDVSDWYKITWTDDSRMNYLVDGAAKPVQLRMEEIGVKGRAEVIRDTVRYTEWGPIVYDDPTKPLYNYAFHWMTHDVTKSTPVSQFARLDCAADLEGYKRALSGFDCPAQNFIFADRQGDIGIRVQGVFPIRKGDDGRFLQDGSKSENAWSEFVPQSDIPQMYNPQRGFVGSANQNSTEPSYPYFAKYGSWDQYRGRNLVMWLTDMQNATVDSMKAMQASNFSLRAQEGKKVMLQLLDKSQLNEVQLAIANDIAQWNSSYDKDISAPFRFEMWFDSTYQLMFDEVMVQREKGIVILAPETWRMIELMEKDTNNTIFDLQLTPERETARQIVTIAFLRMSEQAAKSALTGTVNWGQYHKLSINHLARIAPFSRKDIPIGGHGSALNAIKNEHGPSWRMIVDLGEEVTAYGVYPGGQSGNPSSKYYDNLLDSWVNNAYYPLQFWKTPEAAPSDKVLAKQTFNQPK